MRFVFFILISVFGLYSYSIAEDSERVGDSVNVLLLNSDGYVMVEGELEFVKEWAHFEVGEPLRLEKHARVSMIASGIAKESTGTCEGIDPAIAAAQVGFCMTTKWPGAGGAPAPLRPYGNFYSTEFPDGGLVLIQIPPDAIPDEATARYQGVDYELHAVTPLDAARLQWGGEKLDPREMFRYPEYLVSMADTYNIVAFADQIGQMEALEYCAEVMVGLEMFYHQINGQYSNTLCQLYTGPSMIVADIPCNPYDFNRNLCATEYGQPRADGYIRYYPYKTGESPDDMHIYGFAIAIVGPGEEAEPPPGLPGDVDIPRRAVKWIEVFEEEKTPAS